MELSPPPKFNKKARIAAYRAPSFGQQTSEGSLSNGEESDAAFYDARSYTD